MGGGQRIEHGADGRRSSDVELDERRSAGVLAQSGGQPDRDRQLRTAVFTQTTGGRWRIASLHDSPASADANRSPVRVPM